MKTLLKIYAGVLGQPALLLRLGGLMMVLLVGYQIAMLLAFGSLLDSSNLRALELAVQQNATRIVLGVFVYWVLYIWLTTMFAIRWHRYILLGESRYRFLDAAFGKRGWRFVWKSVLIGLVAVVAVLPFWLFIVLLGVPAFMDSRSSVEQITTVVNVLTLVCFLPGLYVFGRCAMVFPATSLGVTMGIGDSWHATRGHGLRILGLLIAMSIPAIVGSEISVRIVPSEGLPIWLTTAVATLIGVFFVLITTALWASVLSHAYKALNLPLRPLQR